MRQPALALMILLAVAMIAPAQDYDGPLPEKADVPFLLHAHNLIETEHEVAQEVKRKNETENVVQGAASPVRTPLAEPIFIFRSGTIDANKLSMWQMEVKDGNRVVTLPNDPQRLARRGPFPVHLMMREVADNVYWVEVNQVLENGQYCLSPSGSQDVFCFEIY